MLKQNFIIWNQDTIIHYVEDFLAYNLYLYVSNNPINNNYYYDGNKKKTTKKKKKSNNLLKIWIGLGLAAVGVVAIVASGGSLAPAVVGAAKVIGVTIGVAVGTKIAKNIVNSITSGGDKKDVKKNIFNNIESAAADGILAGGEKVYINTWLTLISLNHIPNLINNNLQTIKEYEILFFFLSIN